MWVQENMEEAFAEAAQAGHLLEWVVPSEAASQLIALWDGLQIQWLLKVNDINIADRLEHFISLHLTGRLSELVAEDLAREGDH